MPLVVETLRAATLAELRTLRDRETRADLLELRLDGVTDLDVAGALEGRRHPVIVTCRPTWEGGSFDGSEEERAAILTQAAALGADFVDVEWHADRRLVEACCGKTKVILSHHDFTGVPADLRGRVDAMRRVGADVVKVAVTAQSARDCLTLKRAVDGGENHVAIAMGSAGQMTRMWPAWIGSLWTYAGTAAPGQISVADSLDRYRVHKVTARSAAYAIAGSPIGHSASPAMHNAAFAALGMDAIYVPVETKDAAEFLEVAAALGLSGASVTIPLKQALASSDVKSDALVSETGALNTLRRGPAGWEGRNFDVAGFLSPLERRGIVLRDRRALVLGAGGAARAAVWALRSQGADVFVAARRREAAEHLARELSVGVVDWPPGPDGTRGDVVINTTPVGMWPRVGESPLPAESLESCTGTVVYDLIYNPAETALLTQTREMGATTIGGLEMLVDQACRQFEWWTERQAPRDVMEQAARAFIEIKGREAMGGR